ncbi:MAG: hypothetical protein LCH84_00985 [Gemmatimonadetes bacterium]|nr:hypothetical protein [Gemmatimonadota bacterium]
MTSSRFLRRGVLAACLFGVQGACASSSGAPAGTTAAPAAGTTRTSGSAPTTTTAAARRGDALYSDETVPMVFKDAPMASMRRLAGTPAEVLAAVRVVYASLEVPITVDDARTMQVGNGDFFRTRTFAGKPMNALLQCGSSMTGPAAASYRIYMSLLTSVVPDGDGHVKAAVLFTATARNIAESASAFRVACGSTGVLESLMLNRVAERLAK